jgi:hypothetical protein
MWGRFESTKDSRRIDPSSHLSLNKDAPVPRAVERAERILCRPVPVGLHHQYSRI